jgi:uncharacterized membrane protein
MTTTFEFVPCSLRSRAATCVSLALLLIVVAACAKETTIDEYPCPQGGTKLTYDNFGKAFVDSNCQTCHGQPSADRNGAPGSFDFGTLDAIRGHKDRIFARAAADNTSMPPGPDGPPGEERGKLAEWLACGAP